MKASEKHKRDTRWIFVKQGTCSRTLYHILNHEFGNGHLSHEKAADPLAGGILRKGHQCGMLWGAVMAAGAEAYRKSDEKSIGLAMKASQYVVDSFTRRTGTIDCSKITLIDFNNRRQTLRYMFSGRFLSCFRLADKWAPEAIMAVNEGLKHDPSDMPDEALSCASEVINEMGGSEKEACIVAGLAGGIGFSGGGCGALGAAVWMNTVKWQEENPGKSGYNNPMAEGTLKAFLEATGNEFLCHKICGRIFNSVQEHTEFVKNGGCLDLISLLAN